MYEVITVGSAVIDILVKSDQFKVMKNHEVDGGVALCEVYGGKTDVQQITISPGGGALNAAISFARKGLLSAPTVKVGNDWASEMIFKIMQKEKVGQSLVVKSEGETGMSVVLIAPDGGRSILTHRGVAADMVSRETDWDECIGAKWFYVASTGGNKNFLEDVFSMAGKNRAKIAFNPGRGELAWGKELLNFVRKTNVVFMNRMEVSNWLDIEYGDDSGLYAKIRELELPMLVMTEGNKGVSVFHEGKVVKAEAFSVKSIDDTGAGDAFGSSFIFALNSGWDLSEIIKFASANAASVVQKLGATEGLLDLTLYKSWEKRNLVIEESSY